ncbi:MAG: csrA [Solirubrobacterales bacterium]|jgi:carbon storage regulator|nr:csrA [Solirubrobacterales bacterium]
MLVLTRKSNQSIMIGDDIEVSVLSIMGEKVRIGIQAPRDIPVFRKEVYLEIQEERGEVVAAGVRTSPSSDDAPASDGDDPARSLRAEVDRELRQLGGS